MEKRLDRVDELAEKVEDLYRREKGAGEYNLGVRVDRVGLGRAGWRPASRDPWSQGAWPEGVSTTNPAGSRTRGEGVSTTNPAGRRMHGNVMQPPNLSLGGNVGETFGGDMGMFRDRGTGSVPPSRVTERTSLATGAAFAGADFVRSRVHDRLPFSMGVGHAAGGPLPNPPEPGKAPSVDGSLNDSIHDMLPSSSVKAKVEVFRGNKRDFLGWAASMRHVCNHYNCAPALTSACSVPIVHNTPKELLKL
ncbi:unnamed protein product, partial [Discosporangium mesarthrocarpum]